MGPKPKKIEGQMGKQVFLRQMVCLHNGVDKSVDNVQNSLITRKNTSYKFVIFPWEIKTFVSISAFL